MLWYPYPSLSFPSLLLYQSSTPTHPASLEPSLHPLLPLPLDPQLLSLIRHFFLLTYLILAYPKTKISKNENKNHLPHPLVPLQSPFWFLPFTEKLLKNSLHTLF